MSLRNLLLLVFAFAGSVLAYSGEFVPKSYYVIDQNGQKSDVIYFRSKRDVELFPLFRFKRGGGSSSSQAHSHSSATSSGSSSSASSSSSSSSGGGGAFLYPDGFNYNPGITDPGFNPYHNLARDFAGHLGGGGGGGGGGGSGGHGGHSQSFASASSSSSSGFPGAGGHGGYGGADNLGYNGPILFSRIGEDTGTGVKVAGSAQGEKGAFSSSSSSIDSTGKIKYSVKSGKY